jgi:hypothetical protein
VRVHTWHLAHSSDDVSVPTPPVDLANAVSQYGAQVKKKLGGINVTGQPEDQLRAPLEKFFSAICQLIGNDPSKLAIIGETSLSAMSVRPDYAVEYDGALVGFIEVKAPGKGADPRAFSASHDREQWKKLQALPNLIYTDGQAFSLYQSGERVGEVRSLNGDLASAGAALTATDTFLTVFAGFMSWNPVAPESPAALAEVSAKLCQLLRDEVSEQIALSNSSLTSLRDEWKSLLFPEATDEQFADWYAQAVTFGLLLARARGIDVKPGIEYAAKQLAASTNSLIGSALRILVDTPGSEQTLRTSVATMGRVLAVVDWDKVSQGNPEAWLYFYEGFLQIYDTKLRKKTGSYYTPPQVTTAMIRLVSEALTQHLGRPTGFADPAVTCLDPAMGSGTFMLEILRSIAISVAADQGPGAVPPALAASLSRLVGFELQLGPFAVAQLRILAELADFGVSDVGPRALRTYITNTLDDPYVEETQLGNWYKPITDARRAANKVKASEQVLVVTGNPPYKDRSRGAGGWIEHGAEGYGVPMQRFMPDPQWGVGAHSRHLYNAYVYFWRWATWKVFDSLGADDTQGVVCFITVAGFVNGPGFQGMRRYLRQTCDHLWVIDCSPEGFTPPVNTRIFEAMKHEVCITLALRSKTADPDTPAQVHYRQLRPGHRTDKFTELGDIHLGFDDWQLCGDDWRDPFLPQASDEWSSYLALEDVFLYHGTGIMSGRSWIVDVDADQLEARWKALISATDRDQKRNLFREHRRDRTIDKRIQSPLPGYDPGPTPIADETGPCPAPIRIAFRSFDRRWIIPDKRLINQPNPTLWSGRSPDQVWLTAPIRESPSDGPALTACSEIPDVHHYNGRGGRAFPLWQDGAATVPNIHPALLDFLSSRYEIPVTPADAVAYIAALCAHPAYTATYAPQLETPGIRFPWTRDPELFIRGRDLGAQVLWLHTHGTAYSNPALGRPAEPPRLPATQRPNIPSGGTIPASVDDMPNTISYDGETQRLHIGDGIVANVTPAMWDYKVSGVQVVREWFNARKRDRTPTVIGDRTVSPLWRIHSDTWQSSYTAELLDLLNVLGLLSALEAPQAELLQTVAQSPLWTVADLTGEGVLPITDAQRAVTTHREGTLF